TLTIPRTRTIIVGFMINSGDGSLFEGRCQILNSVESVPAKSRRVEDGCEARQRARHRPPPALRRMECLETLLQIRMFQFPPGTAGTCPGELRRHDNHDDRVLS